MASRTVSTSAGVTLVAAAIASSDSVRKPFSSRAPIRYSATGWSLAGNSVRSVQSRCSCSVNSASARAIGSRSSDSSRSDHSPTVPSGASGAAPAALPGRHSVQWVPVMVLPQMGQVDCSSISSAGFSSSSAAIASVSSTELMARIALAAICLGVTRVCSDGCSCWFSSIDMEPRVARATPRGVPGVSPGRTKHYRCHPAPVPSGTFGCGAGQSGRGKPIWAVRYATRRLPAPSLERR